MQSSSQIITINIVFTGWMPFLLLKQWCQSAESVIKIHKNSISVYSRVTGNKPPQKSTHQHMWPTVQKFSHLVLSPCKICL